MAKIKRYNGNLRPFGDDSMGLNRTVFGGETQSDELNDNINADFLKGWEIVGPNDFPTLEDFNAMGFTLGQLIAYLHQMGVPEWNAAQEYHLGSVVTTGGVIYICKTNNLISASNPSANPTNWNMVPTSVINTLTSTSTTGALSAAQGKELQDTTVKLTGGQTIAGVKTFRDNLVLNNNSNETPSFMFIEPINNSTCKWDMASETPRFTSSYRGGAPKVPLSFNIQTGDVNGQNGVLSGYNFIMSGGNESALPYNTMQTRLSSANFTARSFFVSGVCKAAINSTANGVWSDVLMNVALVDLTSGTDTALWEDLSTQTGNFAAGGKLIVPFAYGSLTLGRMYRIDMRFTLKTNAGPAYPKMMSGMFHH